MKKTGYTIATDTNYEKLFLKYRNRREGKNKNKNRMDSFKSQ